MLSFVIVEIFVDSGFCIVVFNVEGDKVRFV